MAPVLSLLPLFPLFIQSKAPVHRREGTSVAPYTYYLLLSPEILAHAP